MRKRRNKRWLVTDMENTIQQLFRVNSYEKATIEERVKVSGMKKQDYIVRSCIYNHVCVVGKKQLRLSGQK